MWRQFRPNRTIALSGVAVFLAVLTLIDQTSNSTSRALGSSGTPGGVLANPSSAAIEAPAKGMSSDNLWGQVLSLRYLLENAELIQKRYQSVSVPYAESVAPIGALHSVDEKPNAVVAKSVQALVDPAIQVKAMIVSEGIASQRGVTQFNVSLSLESRDSQAMLRTLLALGDAASGSIWKELSVGIDSERRAVKVGGTLTVLAIQQAE